MDGLQRSRGEAGAWAALEPLNRIANAGTDVLIDVAASRTLGAPVIIATPAPGSGKRNLLTPRQIEVAELVAEGLSNKQIARALSLQLSTVKDHVHAVLTRLNCASRAQLIAAWHSSN
ncbi:MAG: response regulator transcription factor [Hyphomicrobiaceae bacterium]|nr:response regulator transcription factor [Hyphomicrobiaceae bacterium]